MNIDRIDLSDSAFLLDIDGTLLDIAPTPHAVVVPPELKTALPRLSRLTGGALALVSGRSLANIDGLFAPLVFSAIGGHGVEIRAPGHPAGPPADHPIDDVLRNLLGVIATRIEGVMIEDKDYSIAVHYRRVPQRAAAVQAAVVTACKEHPSDALEILPGKLVFEVKSRAYNKGKAVRELMTMTPFAGRRPIFVGDDVTDQSAFAVMREFDGLGFSVGERIEGLAGHFAEPSDVRTWIYNLVAAGEARQAAPPTDEPIIERNRSL